MRRILLLTVAALAVAGMPAVASAASADDASCMGLGASFYGQFAPRQMAFVADYVNDTAKAAGLAPGATYSLFAGEKEGGQIPAPCGTRLE